MLKNILFDLKIKHNLVTNFKKNTSVKFFSSNNESTILSLLNESLIDIVAVYKGKVYSTLYFKDGSIRKINTSILDFLNLNTIPEISYEQSRKIHNQDTISIVDGILFVSKNLGEIEKKKQT